MPRLGAMILAGIALILGTTAAQATAAQAQTTAAGCGVLAGMYDEYVKTADTMIMELVGQALQGNDGSGMLQQLGLGT